MQRPLLAVLFALALFLVPQIGHADVVVAVTTPVPNILPQIPGITACSSVDTLGASTCGGFSDTLSLTLLGQGTAFGAISEAGETPNLLFGPCGVNATCGNFFGPLGGGAINIRIPNANWFFQAIFVWREPGDAFISDGLVFWNSGTNANLWLGSNFIDPPSFPGPNDFPASSFFDVFAELAPVGLDSLTPIDITNNVDQTTGNVTLPANQVPTAVVPEPSSIVLLLVALIGLMSFRRYREAREQM